MRRDLPFYEVVGGTQETGSHWARKQGEGGRKADEIAIPEQGENLESINNETGSG